VLHRQLQPQTFQLAHGFVYQKGVKEAKSGKPTNPLDIIDEYGSDAFRYFFASRFSGEDTDYTPELFKEVYNADLANNLGNFVSRTITLRNKLCPGHIPLGGTMFEFNYKQWETFMDAFDYKNALGMMLNLLDQSNKRLDAAAPWKTKDAAGVWEALRTIAVLAYMTAPFMPKTAAALNRITLNQDKPEDKILFPRKI
jgi:methionyl-tRNA synthetase